MPALHYEAVNDLVQLQVDRRFISEETVDFDCVVVDAN